MDKITISQRSENMRHIRSKDSSAELAVRRLLYDMGYRYRLHSSKLPGKPDIVFGKRSKVIFVHGCFWHQHDDENCRIVHLPKSNLDYWLPKLERNKSRDAEKQAMLNELGWDVLVVWECMTADCDALKERLLAFLGP